MKYLNNTSSFLLPTHLLQVFSNLNLRGVGMGNFKHTVSLHVFLNHLHHFCPRHYYNGMVVREWKESQSSLTPCYSYWNVDGSCRL